MRTADIFKLLSPVKFFDFLRNQATHIQDTRIFFFFTFDNKRVIKSIIKNKKA